MYSTLRQAAIVHLFLAVSMQVGIGCFSVGGNFSHSSGSTNTKHQYDAVNKKLTISGAQIIGWVCTTIPEFPKAEVH